MNGIHNPLYLAALNNERIAERRVIGLEELARDARRIGHSWRKGWARVWLVPLGPAVWARGRWARTESTHQLPSNPETKVVVS